MAAFPIGHDPGDTYLHQALAQFEHLANEDVEMKAPLSELAVFLVLDTNILLHHFEVLAQFVDDVEQQSLPLIVIVPGAVIYELDGQKNRDGLAWFARRATAWLLAKIKERRSVRGQAQEETCKSTGNWKIREQKEIVSKEMYNDNLILDCCLFFKRERPTALLSADNNLCINCQAQSCTEVETISPSLYWSSREIAGRIYGDNVDLGQFKGYKESYKNGTRKGGASVAAAADDEDGMAVDEEGLGTTAPQHPISMLHEAIIDHFTRLLMGLVGRVGGDEVRQRSTAEEEANMSRYAPRRRPYTEWRAADLVEYLVKNAPGGVRMRQPRPEVFLRKGYTTGGRTGREWSRRDWEVAMENLGEVSRAWNDVSIRESVAALEPHIEYVFSLPLGL
ncbi:hypothetical protein BDN70DRAFT_907640 [Pholiota conissans]|uniref:PIN domain-containing protein n=1 Tax=Pholiota conissans TaxID=109636 RepID=A0A9P5YXJ3_9AGAR|nr:hypothetical protein BDN70DRAFT_907640 [Pholiota conissans]